MLVDINLLPEKEKERSTLLVAALAILGAAVLLWLILFILSNGLAKETETLDRQTSSVLVQQSEIRSKLQSSEYVNEKKSLEATVEWAENYQFDTVPLLDELISLLPVRGFFKSFEFMGPHLAKVEVQFDSTTEAAHYFTRLQSSSTISEVALNSVTTESVNDEVESYSAEILPRYIAVYTIQFVDERAIGEGTAKSSDETEEEEILEGGDMDDPSN